MLKKMLTSIQKYNTISIPQDTMDKNKIKATLSLDKKIIYKAKTKNLKETGNSRGFSSLVERLLKRYLAKGEEE